MNRILMLLAATGCLAIINPALAEDGAGTATQAAHDALADKADVPAKPPTLPSQASDRATFVHENIAFGNKGEAMRAAHSEAQQHGTADADAARADAASRAAQGAAASAAGAANADEHTAAAQSRATHSKPSSVPSPHGP